MKTAKVIDMRELGYELSRTTTYRVMKLLQKEPMCAKEIAAKTRMKESQISHLIKGWKKVGLIGEVSFNSTGKKVRHGYKYYRATDLIEKLRKAIADEDRKN